MDWFINDLSLDGQFSDLQTFYQTLENLLKLRSQHETLRQHLFCSRLLGKRPVCQNDNLQQVIFSHKNPTFKRQVLEWIGKSGPFWNDARAENPNDYFTFETDDVTEQGLGEACRRQLSGQQVANFSFTHERFKNTPLIVQHGWQGDESELDFGQVAIQNSWELNQLTEAIQMLQPELTSWKEMIAVAKERFTNLIFATDIEAVLQAHPFSRCVKQRVFELLEVLQQLVDETYEDNALSEKGKELHQQHFVGEKAWFSDSSETEKKEFKTELTFKDPTDATKSLECPWHGKIKTPQFRIHFEWSRPKQQREIKVVYIGPKITKR